MATQTPPDRDAVRGFVPKLIEMTETVVYGDVWERDRSLITVAALVALGRGRQLKGHVGRALDNGVTPEELSELTTHLALYAGWPAAMTAAPVARDAVAERGAG